MQNADSEEVCERDSKGHSRPHVKVGEQHAADKGRENDEHVRPVVPVAHDATLAASARSRAMRSRAMFRMSAARLIAATEGPAFMTRP